MKTQENKKVALIINHLSGGGAERAVAKISFAFSKYYDVYIVLSDASRIDYHFSGDLVDLGIKHSSNILFKVINFFRRVHRLRKVKRQYNFDVAVSFHELSNVANLFSKNNEKIVLSVRNVLSERNKAVLYDRFYGILVRFFYNRADRIIAVSQMCKHDLVRNYHLDSDKVRVIYNLYNIDEIRQLCSKGIDEDVLPEGDYIITMGRLSHAKGQWHLVRAFQKVIEEFPDLKLYILGDGELRNYLETLVSDMGLKNNIVFKGFQKNPFAYLAGARLFVFPSLFEGFPNALVEAMACGIPVVSSDCLSGPREILAPGTDVTYQTSDVEYAKWGVLVPVGDGRKYLSGDSLSYEESLIANAIINMLRNEQMRKKYSKKAQRRAHDYKVEKISEFWINEIGSIHE
ncbi:MAG: glycosyltransferase [bacterium]